MSEAFVIVLKLNKNTIQNAINNQLGYYNQPISFKKGGRNSKLAE